MLTWWRVGRLSIGDMTREQLLAEAAAEERKSNGHLKDAKLYKAIAKPMHPGQLVRDYWESPEAIHMLRDEIWKQSP